LEETINQDYNELNGIFEKNNIIIYSIDNIHKLDLECEMKDELKSYMPSEKKNRLE
jgi:hypothetical protein